MAYPMYTAYSYSLGQMPEGKPLPASSAPMAEGVLRSGVPKGQPPPHAKAHGVRQQLEKENHKKASEALESMKGSLRKWLKFRRRMDAYVAGKVKSPALFRNPGAKPLPPAVVAQTLNQERFSTEQDLAETLHGLLIESGVNGEKLPAPDVGADPNAAVKLAKIALDAGAQGEQENAKNAQGVGVFWLILIPVAGAALVLMQMIRSKAELAAKKEELRCIEIGACTDYGFWLKVASVAVIGWVAWDKLGVRELAGRTKKKAGGR